MTITTEELRNLVARGTLSKHDTVVAALLGEPAALPLAPTVSADEGKNLREWLKRLVSEADEPRKQELMIRTAIGAARGDLAWTAQQADYLRTQPGIVDVLTGVLDTVDDWVVCPCDRHVRAVAGSIAYLPNDAFTESARFTAQAITCDTAFAPKWGTREGFVRRAVEAGGAGLPHIVLPMIRTEVVPWVLRAGDAVKERVAARQGRGSAHGPQS